eukprot:1407378-Rhodomonas_salina.1
MPCATSEETTKLFCSTHVARLSAPPGATPKHVFTRSTTCPKSPFSAAISQHPSRSAAISEHTSRSDAISQHPSCSAAISQHTCSTRCPKSSCSAAKTSTAMY